ncbi:MAG: choice-of-anchor D domain-containing protein, partial [Archangium sp.]|nr:choice-of-anchor D domain-containing protein [Archangium sp.]
MSNARALASLLVTLAAFSGCIDPSTFSPAPDAGPGVVRAPDCLRMPEQIDFGEVNQTGRGDRQFFLSNNTLKSITVEIGALDDPFFSSVEGLVTIESGERVPLRISFLPPDGRLHVTSFDFLGGAGCTRQTVEVRGLGAGEILAPSFVDFGSLPVNQPVSRRVTISNTRRSEVNGSVSLTGAGFTGPATFSIPPLGAVELEITATALSHSQFNGTLQLASNRGDNLFIGLAASGGVPELQLDHPSLRINTLPAPSENGRFPLFQRTITLHNVGDGELRIPGFSIRANPGSEVDELSVVFLNHIVPAEMTSTLLVHFRPRPTLGPRSWSIRFSTNQPNLPTVEIPITAEVVEQVGCGGAMITNPP